MLRNRMSEMQRTIFKYFRIIILKKKKDKFREINIKNTDLLFKTISSLRELVEHYLDIISISQVYNCVEKSDCQWLIFKLGYA